MDKLLERGTDVDVTITKDEATALHLAAQNCNANIIKHLLEHHAYIQIKPKVELPPMVSASLDDDNSYDISVEAGANANAKDNNGWTPLCYAADAGQARVVTILLANKADVSIKNAYGWTALWVAWLDITTQPSSNLRAKAVATFTTPQQLARQKRSNQSWQTILKLASSKDDNGWTPLHLAANNGYVDVVKLLLDHKADVNASTAEWCDSIATGG